MNYFDPRTYVPSMKEKARYKDDVYWDGYTVMKNHYEKGYIQLMFPSSSEKGHDTYDIYLDSEGRLKKVVGHSTNVGFNDTKYY